VGFVDFKVNVVFAVAGAVVAAEAAVGALAVAEAESMTARSSPTICRMTPIISG